MCLGISLSWRTLPDELIERHALQGQIITREEGADREVRFMYNDPVPRLPALVDNRLDIYLWGNRDDKQSRLPRTGWCRIESLEEGRWRHLAPRRVVIPASFGLAKGVWFHVAEGMEGILVCDERRREHVYMLTCPAARYYEVMTKDPRMPVFVGKDFY